MSTAVNASSPASAQAPASDSGSALVNEFRKYIGHKYFFSGYYYDPKGWDCSSAFSWVIQQCGITPPGGHYDGRSHGPATGQYAVWTGAKTIPHSQMAAGDYAIYATHIAMVTTPGNGISAEDPANGTREAPLSSGPGPYAIRRIKAAATSAGSGANATDTSLLGGGLSALSFANIGTDLINGLTGALGVDSLVDAVERGGLILLGIVLLIIGVWKAANN